jgi:hypothetical protein
MINLRLIVSGGKPEAGVRTLSWSLPLDVEARPRLGGVSRLLLFAGVLPSFAIEVGGVGMPRLQL